MRWLWVHMQNMDNSELETEAGTLEFTGHYGDEKVTERKAQENAIGGEKNKLLEGGSDG